MNNYYTMVGARNTPEDVLLLMERLAYKLSLWGWIGRSGGAGGADTCLEEAISSNLDEGFPSSASRYMEVYLPWKDFNGRYSAHSGYHTLPDMPNKNKAQVIAETLHPNWNACSQGAQKLHTRNVYQVLGQDLNTPSTFLVCYAKPKGNGGHVQGGTGTSVKLAIDNGVQVFNMYLEEDRKRIEKWIGEIT